MAEEALKILEDQLNCSVCLDTYTDPKLLQCFHVYCQQCLVPLVDRDQQGQLGITCPKCRQVTPVLERGVAGLQPAFHINHLIEIQKTLEENPSATLDGEDAGSVTARTCTAPTRDAPRHCFEHAEEELKLYCETCGSLICLKCAIRSGKHHNHDYVEIPEAFEKYTVEITESLGPMEEQVTVIKRTLAMLDTSRQHISNQQVDIKGNIHGTFRLLQEVLSARETELINQLDQTTQRQLKSISAQKDQLETTLAQLYSCLHFTRESLRSCNREDVLMMKTNTVCQVKELTTPFQEDLLKPVAEANLAFVASTDMITSCQNYGTVLSKHTADPSKCLVLGMATEEAAVGETSTVFLQAINYWGEPCKEPIKYLKCKPSSAITGTRASCSVERRGQSQYKISFQPAIKGKHQLQVKVDGEHIRGSPFGMAVKSPDKLNAPILTIHRVKKPWGVALNQKGEAVVTADCVCTFSPSGEKICSFGMRGSGQGQFNHLHGIALDFEGNILVADCWNHRIQKFTEEGKFLAAVGTKGSEPLQFSYPTDIAVYGHNIYIVDHDNHRIQVLNPDLTISASFGKKGSSKGEFSSPYGIACDSKGKVYVTDSDNHRIQVFTAEGEFLSMFGRRGRGEGGLTCPVGIAIDSGHRVYICEGGNHRVSIFTSEGQFVTSFGSRGDRPKQFNFPRGLAVDTSGVVYVCDQLNNRVQMF